MNGVITSGTPFRNILEKIGSMKGEAFVEIGINSLANEKRSSVRSVWMPSRGSRFIMGIGVARHFDAGYGGAKETAELKTVKIPK